MDSDDSFHNLRQRLDALGFTQVLPIAAVPLVGALFEDLVKTTESLRDSKHKIAELLEEKSCWELGVEPYKCDNARLLAECNRLHAKHMNEVDDFTLRTLDYQKKIDNLESDRIHLQDQCMKLQNQLQAIALQQSSGTASNAVIAIRKKPFVSTVRSERLHPVHVSTKGSAIPCTKCGACFNIKTKSNFLDNKLAVSTTDELETGGQYLQNQIAFYKLKAESREREIERLSDLLTGGRPLGALAKDCCYKNIEELTADINRLQREKSESISNIHEYQNRMHEAMRRSLELEERNQELQQELDELKDTALKVEKEANKEIERQARKIAHLSQTVQSLQNADLMTDKEESHKAVANRNIKSDTIVNDEITMKDSETKCSNERLKKMVHRLKKETSTLRKKLDGIVTEKDMGCDNDALYLKSERDFFQTEYLRLLSKLGAAKEVDMLKSELNSKEDEIRKLRMEMRCQTSRSVQAIDIDNNSLSQRVPENSIVSYTSDCVQAAAIRAERERSVCKRELDYMRCERDSLRKQIDHITQLRVDEVKKTDQKIAKMVEQIEQLERDKRAYTTSRTPTERELVFCKGKHYQMNKQVFELQEENLHLKTKMSQLKILQEQTELSLVEYQSKLAFAERNLATSDTRLTTIERTRQDAEDTISKLRTDIKALHRTYSTIEYEKDLLLAKLDKKTEQVHSVENELKVYIQKYATLESEMKELQNTLLSINQKPIALSEESIKNASVIKTLQMQIAALKDSRQAAVFENRRILNEMANTQAEAAHLKKAMDHCTKEVDHLKQQLKQYVQEVEKAEELLSHKEKERDEMLEHYRSLSYDAVLLEGNNQSLEADAADYRRRVDELELQTQAFKKAADSQTKVVENLEDKVTLLTSGNASLQEHVDNLIEECGLLKTDLSAQRELCIKLEAENGKLNEELKELNDIRQKLQFDNEMLRKENTQNDNMNHSSSQTIEDLLTKTRQELEERIKMDSKLSTELVRLREDNAILINNLEDERRKTKQHEVLANEYHIQNQELRHSLTDDLFRQALFGGESGQYYSRNTN